MIDRVIAAIDDIFGSDHESLSIEMGFGDKAALWRKETMTEAGRAAVEALREPTPEMIRAMQVAFERANFASVYTDIWHAGIDVVLESKE